MTTWEIRQHLEENNYRINGKFYMEMIETSYQIIQVECDCFGVHHLTTSDGYDVRFTVCWKNNK